MLHAFAVQGLTPDDELVSGLTDRETFPGPPAFGSIAITPLESANKEAVGLLPNAITGLPNDLWRGSKTDEIAALIRELDTDLLPAALDLLYALLLTEANPPEDSTGEPRILLARIDKLVELGALEQAKALLDRARPLDSALFARSFDIALLTRDVLSQCRELVNSPALAPGYSSRIYCEVMQGDWRRAALIHVAAIATGAISPAEAELLAHFLQPELIEGDEIVTPDPLTPLSFRIREDLGFKHAQSTLPAPYVYQNLAPNVDQFVKLESAERLARTQAIAAELLFSVYLDESVSGKADGWDRVQAFRRLNAAIRTGAGVPIGDALRLAHEEALASNLEVPFSRYFVPRLGDFAEIEGGRSILLRMSLLTSESETATLYPGSGESESEFLRSLTLNKLQGSKALGIGRSTPENLPPAFASAAQVTGIGNARGSGETILRILPVFSSQSNAAADDIQSALAALRQIGLESQAAQLAVQTILLGDMR